jgi:hypothetical protein
MVAPPQTGCKYRDFHQNKVFSACEKVLALKKKVTARQEFSAWRTFQ